MRYETAKKILDKNGICWSNYFDLDFVLFNMDKESNKEIVNAINWMKTFLLTGKKF